MLTRVAPRNMYINKSNPVQFVCTCCRGQRIKLNVKMIKLTKQMHYKVGKVYA